MNIAKQQQEQQYFITEISHKPKKAYVKRNFRSCLRKIHVQGYRVSMAFTDMLSKDPQMHVGPLTQQI